MQVLNIFHVLIAIAMVAFILVQRGPGATAGAAFGSGASGTVFGSRGAGSFLSRTTWILATLFCLISLTMAVVVSRGVATPEADLGVVATPVEVNQPSADLVIDTPILDDTGQGSDLPVLDTADDAPSSGDLPTLDQEAPEPIEPEPEPDDGS
jgi:preprotein translocase subunit SecG